LPQNDEFLRLVINSIRNDIVGRNEAFQCLALNFIGSGAPRQRHMKPLDASPACLLTSTRSTANGSVPCSLTTSC